VILGCWAFLFRWWWLHPKLVGDDYIYIHESADWPSTQANLLRPFNEHIMPITRVVTWLVVQAAPTDRLAAAFAGVNSLLFVAASLQIFLLARREWQGDVWGLAALMLFALSPVPHECIWWYSAAQWMVAFNLLLLAFRILDPARPGPMRVVAASLVAFVGPWNYSLGLLIGPLASLWILLHWRKPGWFALLPTFGACLGLAAVYPLIARGFADPNYLLHGGRGVLKAFDPFGGLAFAVRCTVDQLLLYNMGFAPSVRSFWYHAVAFAMAAGGTWVVVRRSSRPHTLLMALALIAFGYGLTLCFRTWLTYRTILVWGARFHLVPQLGTALFLTGAIATLLPRNDVRKFARLNLPQALVLTILALVLIHLHDIPIVEPPTLALDTRDAIVK
jgi:hypothetical protein